MPSRDPKMQGIYLPSHYRTLDYMFGMSVLQFCISFLYLKWSLLTNGHVTAFKSFPPTSPSNFCFWSALRWETRFLKMELHAKRKNRDILNKGITMSIFVHDCGLCGTFFYHSEDILRGYFLFPAVSKNCHYQRRSHQISEVSLIFGVPSQPLNSSVTQSLISK